MGRLWLDGHTFKSEEEYRRYRGLRELLKEGKIERLEVNPEYPIMIRGETITTYVPTFCFYNTLKQQQQVVQVINNKPNSLMELKMKFFEALYEIIIERW